MNCNNCKNNNTLKEIKIKHVYGNVLRLAIPLTLRTIELVDGEINATDTPFVPSSEHPVKVVFTKKGAVAMALDATMKDGNIAYVEEKGKIPVGTYAITVTCSDDNGNPYRFKQNAVLYVADATIEAGIEETIEYEVTTWYLDAAIYLALKGEDGVGIADIETQSSGEIGGTNTVTFILTDGRTRSFNILNGSGAVDSELDITSPSPISNSAVTEKFNEVSEELAELFGDVDYDSQNKAIRFWDKGKANVLASLDARPFIKDGMVSNVYISNNTLVITFNTDSGREAIGVPLTSVFNPNNYYTKTQVDSRIASAISNVNLTNYYTKSQTDSIVSRITPVEVTFTKNGNNYTCSITLAQLNTHVSNHKPITAKMVGAMGVLLHCDEDYAVFQFADDLGDTFILWCNHGYWERHDGVDIEIDDNPTEESTNAVSSGGVYAALSQKVAGISVNGGTTQWPDDGIVDLTVEGGYEPPVGGIPKTDLASGVQSSLDAADSAYQKPNGGIPKTDLASDVQTSLGKADTALQSHQSLADVFAIVDYDSTTKHINFYGKGDTNKATVLGYVDATNFIKDGMVSNVEITNGNLVVTFNTDSGKEPISIALTNIFNPSNYYTKTDIDNKGYLTTETDPSVPAWAKAQNKPSYTASEVGAVPTTRKVNNKALSADITLTASDVGAVSSTGFVATDNNFTTTLKNKLDGIAEGAEVNVQADWNETNTSSDAYIANKPTIPAAQVQTDWNASSGMGVILNKPSLATVATSGSYNDLTNKPTIPTVGAIAENSTDAAQSGAVYTALAGKQDTLTFDTTPTANSTKPVTSGGIKTYVDGKATITGITTSQDGTFTIALSDGNSYTVYLNHVHPQYTAKKTVESNTDATVTLSADVIYNLGTVAGNKTINLPTTVDAAADYEFRLSYTSGTISGTAISGTTVANDATLTFTAGKTYQVIISGGILYFSETTVSA